MALPQDGDTFSATHMVCHCLLIETKQDGLVLVDTAFGLDDIADADARLGRHFQLMACPKLNVEETAVRQVVRLGYKPSDVRHIVLTHLDLDHAGGMSDFPQARVHVMDDEYLAAQAPQTAAERLRYKSVQWEHGPLWQRHSLPAPSGGERWFGFESVRQAHGLPPEILMIPLSGHSRGHCAVAVDTQDGWLLHAGDQYYHRDEMSPESSRTPASLETMQKYFAADLSKQKHNQQRLRELARQHGSNVRVFCAHDPVELSALQLEST